MKRLLIIAAILLIAGSAWGETYSKRSNGTAANKGAATGSNCAACASDPSTCMSPAVYAGETFADGDVIVHCNSILSGFGDKLILFSQFADVSQTLSIPSAVTTRVTIAADTRTTIGGDTRVTK